MPDASPWWAVRYDALAARDPAFAGAVDAYAERQVALIEQLVDARSGQRFLDLGCGAGRHCVLLQERGHRCTGVDLSPRLIELAQRAWAGRNPGVAGPRFVVGDMRRPPPKGPFDNAIMMDEALGMFDDEADHLRTLTAIADRLREGGRLILELFNPYAWSHRNLTQHFPAGALLPDADLVRSYRFDPLRGRVEDRIVVFDGEGRHELPVQRLRAWTPPEIYTLLTAAGFRDIEVFGSEAWQAAEKPVPLDPERSMFMWVVATR